MPTTRGVRKQRVLFLRSLFTADQYKNQLHITDVGYNQHDN